MCHVWMPLELDREVVQDTPLAGTTLVRLVPAAAKETVPAASLPVPLAMIAALVPELANISKVVLAMEAVLLVGHVKGPVLYKIVLRAVPRAPLAPTTPWLPTTQAPTNVTPSTR